MIYKDFQNIRLSALGLGAMRLPVIDGDDARIDEQAAEQMVAYAMEQGVNYYDTAWGYHSGQSEIALGKALSRYPRDRFFLADKFPGYDLSNMDKVESIFEEQLRKCGVDHFDFYLVHNVCEMNIDAYLDEKYGIQKYLLQQKERGRIKHLGFSVHGSLEVMMRFMDVYGRHMEFCQIQLNYIDWAFQEARAKVEYLNEHKIPIWVMEPMRGGQLAALPAEHLARLQELRPEEQTPAWAFRFLQSIPGVAVVLTGASNFDQLRANIETFRAEKPLQQKEFDTLLDIAESMVARIALPCTACRYCLSHCPQQLDIPALLALYNEHSFTKGGFLAPMALMAVPEDKQPSACVACGSCEEVCPQQIKISEAMADFISKLKAD